MSEYGLEPLPVLHPHQPVNPDLHARTQEIRVTQSAMLEDHSATIFDLPVETLIHIMELSLEEDSSVEYYQNILRTSSVCRAWHAILHDTPSFWSRIAYNLPPELISLALSKNANVDVQIYGVSHESEACADAVIPHTSQYRSVFLEDCALSLVERVLHDRPLQNLEILDIYLRASSQSTLSLRLGNSLSLLSLVGVTIDWDLVSCHNLEEIELEQSGPTNLTYDKLDRLLRCNPSLVSISVEDRELKLPEGPASAVASPIHLPRLQYIALGMPSRSALNLLRNIRSQTSVTAPRLNFEWEGEEAFQDLQQELVEVVHWMNLPSPQCEAISISIWDNTIDLLFKYDHEHGDRVITFGGDYPKKEALRLIIHILSNFIEVRSIRLMLVSRTPVFNNAALFDILRNLSQVRSLYINTDPGQNIRPLLHSLARPTENASGDNISWPFPLLQRLAIELGMYTVQDVLDIVRARNHVKHPEEWRDGHAEHLPLEIKTISLPEEAAHGNLDSPALIELQTLVGAGNVNLT